MRLITVFRREPLWLRAGSALALFCVLALLALSLRALSSSHALQSRLDRAWALDAASERLRPSLRGGGSALDLALAAIVEREPWGFRYLAVLDGDGQAVAARGRYESLTQESWLPSLLRRWLRLQLYTAFGEVGQLSVRDAVGALGTLEYSLGPSTQRLVHDEAVDRLRSTGLIGALLSLLFGGSGFWLLRGHLRARAELSAGRWSPPDPVAAPAVPGSSSVGTDELGRTFDALQMGLLLVDAKLQVRAINGVASQLTGWSAGDALGQVGLHRVQRP